MMPLPRPARRAAATRQGVARDGEWTRALASRPCGGLRSSITAVRLQQSQLSILRTVHPVPDWEWAVLTRPCAARGGAATCRVVAMASRHTSRARAERCTGAHESCGRVHRTRTGASERHRCCPGSSRRAPLHRQRACAYYGRSPCTNSTDSAYGLKATAAPVVNTQLDTSSTHGEHDSRAAESKRASLVVAAGAMPMAKLGTVLAVQQIAPQQPRAHRVPATRLSRQRSPRSGVACFVYSKRCSRRNRI